MIVVSNIVGLFAIIFWISSIQNKEKKSILLFQIIANSLYSLQYFLLGAYSASSMDFIGIIKNLLFYNYTKDDKNIPLYALILITFIYLFFGVITYNGLISLIPISISILYTLGSFFKNANYIRLTVLLGAFFWIYYNIRVGAYIGVIGNLLEVISSIISLTRFRKSV